MSINPSAHPQMPEAPWSILLQRESSGKRVLGDTVQPCPLSQTCRPPVPSLVPAMEMASRVYALVAMRPTEGS